MEHHAYYIEGPLSHFAAYKEKLDPFWAREYERFGIEEARALIQLASLKNFGEATFFIATASLTSEAQQALLKLFEEPQRGTTFVLLVSHGALIGTLRSRMLPYPSLEDDKASLTGQAKKFLSRSYKERSEEVAAMLKDEEGVRERAREFVNELERELELHLRKSATARAGLADIAKVRSYLGDRSPSLKMLLEHLALSLPTLK